MFLSSYFDSRNKYKIGFLISGILNEYNFIIIFSCAYSLSMNKNYIHPSLLILFEIVPGFITQLLYPLVLYKIPYHYRWILLYFLQILNSLFLIINPDNLILLLSAISLVSINSYLGESSMLSLSSYYDTNELRFWNIGNGLASPLGSGMYLLMNLIFSERVIFIINLGFYIIGFSVGLYLLDFKNKINIICQEDPEVAINQEIEPVDFRRSYVYFLSEIYSVLFAYFFSFLFLFGYVPLLIQNDLEYQITVFLMSVSLFIGRLSATYMNVRNIRLFGMIHLYNLIMMIFFTVTIHMNISIPLTMVNIIFSLSNFLNGLCYPIVYQHIYKNYIRDKEWYMGSVGQYTSFFTILGCTLGYIIQFTL